VKLLRLFFLALLASCSTEDEPMVKCNLVAIVVTGRGSLTQTNYSYNPAGKMARQTRLRDGTLVFDYFYSYNANGKVDKVRLLDRYFQYEYGSDGKLTSVSEYLTNGAVDNGQPNSVETYSWKGNILEIRNTKMGKPKVYQIAEFEFANDNIVRDKYQTFTGSDPNVVLGVSERFYEDFDTALSAFYVAGSTRPGFPEASKNNPRKVVQNSTTYIGGSINQRTTTTTTYSYTYNTSNATIASTANTNDTFTETRITYDLCE